MKMGVKEWGRNMMDNLVPRGCVVGQRHKKRAQYPENVRDRRLKRWGGGAEEGDQRLEG